MTRADEKFSVGREQEQAIDALRGVAIFIVMLVHYKNLFLSSGGWLSIFTTPGVQGVILFFVLSGFCIGTSVRRRPVWTEFYSRRFFRLYPAAWACLLPLVALRALTTNAGATQSEWLATILLIPGLEPSVLHFNFPLWSIQTEIELYVLCPISYFILKRWGSAVLLWISSGVTLLALGLWIYNRTKFSYYPPFPGLCYWGLWNFGFCQAFAKPETTLRGRELWWGCSAIVFGSGVLLLRNYFHSNLFSFWYLVCGYGWWLLMRMALASPSWFAQRNILQELGKRSYVIYLAHGPIAMLCLYHWPVWKAFCITIICVIIVVEVVHRGVEIPGIRLGRRLVSKSAV